MKRLILLTAIAVSFAACKKDKNETPDPQPVEVKTITITELRTLSTETTVKLPDGRKVKGIVISDAAAKNVDNKTVVIQEATDKPAVVATFDAAQTFAVGDELELTISNQTLAKVNGEIVLQNIPAANVKKTGTGTVTPRVTTIADINTNKSNWDGTLVTINATEITSADGKYKGQLTVKDASGELKSSILAGAVIENTDLPASISKFTGILRLNGTETRIDIRTATDVTTGDVTTVEYLEVDGLFGVIGGSRVMNQKNPVPDDISFADKDKLYGYLLRVSTPEGILARTPEPSALYIYSKNMIKPGAKEVTISFSASKLQGAVDGDALFQRRTGFFTLDPFDGTKHNVKIGVGLASGSRVIPNIELIGQSPVYNEAGKFYSFKVKLPTTDAELIALGVTNELTRLDFLANPKIAIYNLSVKRSTAGAYEPEGGYAPVLIDRLAVGY